MNAPKKDRMPLVVLDENGAPSKKGRVVDWDDAECPWLTLSPSPT